MSQPVHTLPSPSSSPSSSRPPPAHSTVHTCRWDWCRLTFPTNALLIHHVIHEHVRKAQPVRRRDLPLLRRAEEGFGESLRWSGMTDNLPSTFPSDSNIHTSSLAASTHSPRPSKRARIETPSQAENSSPTQESRTDLQIHPKSDPIQPTSLTSHTPPAPQSNSQSPSTNTKTNAHKPSTPSPHSSPTQSQPRSPRRTSFAQLSSQDSSPDSIIAPDSLPTSPSFNSQVANAVRALTSGFGFGFRGRGSQDASLNYLHASPSPSPSPSPVSLRKRKERAVSLQRVSPARIQGTSPIPNSQTSQEIVERELTQGVDSDVDMDSEPEPDQRVDGAGADEVVNKAIGVTGAADDSQHALGSVPLCPEGQRHREKELDAELEWPDIEIPSQPAPIADNSLRPQSQSQQGTSQDASLPPLHSAPFVLHTQAPWPSSSFNQRQQHTPQPSPTSLGHDLDRTPSQTQNRIGKPRNSFRSGSLRLVLGKGPKESTHHLVSGNGSHENESGSQDQVDVGADAEENVSMETDGFSQAIAQSQGSGSGGYRHSYFQLQTQAPYGSQSFSQSLSETSAG